jgi:glycerol-3-phosphate dehydrogenase (NAD(P)+)
MFERTLIKGAKMKKVAIIGAGVMGTAMAWPLSDNGFEVRLVGTHLDHEIIASCKDNGFHPKLHRRLPEHVFPYYLQEISTALKGIDFIVNGVNSLGIHWMARTLSPYIKKCDKLISVTKGIEVDEQGRLLILPDVLRKGFPKNIQDQVEIAAIGGPCIANELAGRQPVCVMFAAEDINTATYFKEALQTDYYHVWVIEDIVGLEISAALKNAYAMGVGMAEGFLEKRGGVEKCGASMYNLAAALFAQSVNEINKIIRMTGVKNSFSNDLPVAGDLFVTCQKGRSYRLGILLGKGISYIQAKEMMLGETLEAALAVIQMEKVLKTLEIQEDSTKSDFPLMKLLIDVICHQKPVYFELDEFFR